MSLSEELRQFKEYGETILQLAQEYDSAEQAQLLQEETNFTELHSCIKKLQKEAQNLVDRVSAPVKVAVMGEMKASKTTLVGSLLGYAGVLPVSEVAATGNVTYLRIVQVEGRQETNFDFKVEYFDKAEVKECLNFMLQKLKQKASDLQLPKEQLDKMEHLISQETNVWQQVVDWCQEVKNSNDTPNSLSKAITELEVFAQACNDYGEKVYDRSYPIDIDTAHSGLQLRSGRTTIQKQDFEQIPPQKELFPEFLKATFPLIRHIDVEVRVSEAIWNLSSIQGANKLVLLDFPGLGASESALRDQFLSKYEMGKIDTILLLTSARQPGSTRDYEILDILQQQRPNEVLDDFIVVGVGRFDELPQAKEHIDNLLNKEEEEQLTEPTVIQRIPALQKAIESARALTKGNDERIVLLSAFVALDKKQQGYSTIKVASQEILNQLIAPDFQKNSTLLLNKWKQLSKSLKKSQPDSMVATWLEAFCEDGGIGRLRRLLEKHIADHGLEQFRKDASDQVITLCAGQKALQDIISNPSFRNVLASENSNVLILRQTIRELAYKYRTLKMYLEKNPFEFGVSIDESKGGTPLRDVIVEKVTSDIFHWSQWRDLFNKVQVEDGKIRLSDVKRRSIFEKRKGSQGEAEITVVTTTEDLYPVFSETVKKLREFTSEKLLEAIKKFWNELYTEKVSLQADKTTIDLPYLNNQLRTYIKNAESESEDLIHIASIELEVVLSEINEDFLGDSSPEHDTSQDQENSLAETKFKEVCLLTSKDAKTLFPLALEDKESNRVSQTLPWSPNKKRTNQTSENHSVVVLQMRQAIIDSVNEELVSLIGKVNQKFNEIFERVLEDIIRELEKSLNDKERLRRLAIGERRGEEVTPNNNRLEVLQKMASIKCPV